MKGKADLIYQLLHNWLIILTTKHFIKIEISLCCSQTYTSCDFLLSKGIEFLSQTLIFLSLYLCIISLHPCILNYFRSNNNSSKYQRLTPSGCKVIVIWKSEFVVKTQFIFIWIYKFVFLEILMPLSPPQTEYMLLEIN